MKPDKPISSASAACAAEALSQASGEERRQVEGVESASSCINVTPEMKSAGGLVIWMSDDAMFYDDLAVEVYIAMEKIRVLTHPR